MSVLCLTGTALLVLALPEGGSTGMSVLCLTGPALLVLVLSLPEGSSERDDPVCTLSNSPADTLCT
jgi:hypothetical protein